MKKLRLWNKLKAQRLRCATGVHISQTLTPAASDLGHSNTNTGAISGRIGSGSVTTCDEPCVFGQMRQELDNTTSQRI